MGLRNYYPFVALRFTIPRVFCHRIGNLKVWDLHLFVFFGDSAQQCFFTSRTPVFHRSFWNTNL